MTNSSIVVATGTIGTRAVSKNYPVDEGLIAGTTKQIDKPSLEPEEKIIFMDSRMPL